MSKGKILTMLFVLFHVLGLLSSIHAILQTRTPQGSVAWAVSLNTLPIISVPAYWVFGRSKFNGYIANWRDSSLEIESDLDNLRGNFQPFLVESEVSNPEYEAVKQLSGFQLTEGNKVELLRDGHATYDSIASGIEAAETYILFQFYILRPDTSGTRFKELLIKKAEEGLDVYVLYDELGSSGLTSAWLSGFIDAGIRIIPFNTRKGKNNRFQLNFRNHRKIVVTDGTSAWVGGLNIGDDYLGQHKKLTPWRDTHIRVDGPAALTAQLLFVSDWHWADQTFLNDLNWQPQAAAGLDDKGQQVLMFGSGPADTLETASLLFANMLNMARERIWIATPYFIPDEATMVSLRLALLKGLDVRILTPKLNDNWFVRHAANVYLGELARLGARIFFYEQGFMHQKVMLIDQQLAMVGTVNFDNRSFRLNFEITGAVLDTEFATEIETMLLDDIANSGESSDYRLEDQSLWERLKAHGSALFSPVL